MSSTQIAPTTRLLLRVALFRVAMIASLAVGGVGLVFSQTVTPASSVRPRGYLPDLEGFDVIRIVPRPRKATTLGTALIAPHFVPLALLKGRLAGRWRSVTTICPSQGYLGRSVARWA